MAKQRSRGRLPKAEQLEKDLLEMEDDLKGALLKGNEMVAANYMLYMKTLDEAARGEGGVSETNKISCAKVLTQKAEAYFKEVKKAEKASAEEGDSGESETTTGTVSLISLRAVGDE